MAAWRLRLPLSACRYFRFLARRDLLAGFLLALGGLGLGLDPEKSHEGFLEGEGMEGETLTGGHCRLRRVLRSGRLE